jgi:hypothetical protein
MGQCCIMLEILKMGDSVFPSMCKQTILVESPSGIVVEAR